MTNSSSDVVLVDGFTVLQVKLSKEKVLRHLYTKEHSAADTHFSKPSGRTLLVLNVPPYIGQEELKQVFSKCGKIQNVFLHEKPTSGPPCTSSDDNSVFHLPRTITGYQVAYIVFKERAAVNRATTLSFSKQRTFTPVDSSLVTGLAKWQSDYAASGPPAAKKTKKEVEQFMAKYDKEVEKEKMIAREAEGVADEEGWIKVTRHSKNKATQPQTEVQNKRLKRKLKKKNLEKDLLHFYKFQARETKKEQITELRRKFEEDKRQIAQMKADRKFRPY